MLFKSLSLKDKVWCLKNFHSIKKSLEISNTVLITMDSLSKNDKDFYNKNIESGKFDAFRHVLWLYKLSQNIGIEKARRVGQIYENYNQYVFKVNPDSGYDLASKNMDLYNKFGYCDETIENYSLISELEKLLEIEEISLWKEWKIKHPNFNSTYFITILYKVQLTP